MSLSVRMCADVCVFEMVVWLCEYLGILSVINTVRLKCV